MTTAASTEVPVLVRRDIAVAVVTLNRPEAMNARNAAMRSMLYDACAALDAASEIRAVVVTGAGDRAFCAGLDLAEVRDRTLRGDVSRVVGDRNDIAAVAAMTTPTIAAVNGVAVGGGLELALACDLRLAASTARFGLTEVTRGNLPGNGGTQRLPRVVGPAVALHMLLTGELVEAARALDTGLVSAVEDDVLGAALAVAGRIAANAPLAVQAAKQAVYDGVERSLAAGLDLERELSDQLRSTDDWAEGVTAFAEKRAPVWRGR